LHKRAAARMSWRILRCCVQVITPHCMPACCPCTARRLTASRYAGRTVRRCRLVLRPRSGRHGSTSVCNPMLRSVMRCGGLRTSRARFGTRGHPGRVPRGTSRSWIPCRGIEPSRIQTWKTEKLADPSRLRVESCRAASRAMLCNRRSAGRRRVPRGTCRSGIRRRRRSIADPAGPRVEFGNERRAERTSATLRSRVGCAVPGSPCCVAGAEPAPDRAWAAEYLIVQARSGRAGVRTEAWCPEEGLASGRATFGLAVAAMVVRSSKTGGARGGVLDRVGQRAPVGNAPGELRGAAAIAASRSRSAKPRPGRSTE